ncbi:hypothetical protein ACIBG0_38280 [Nocardia sp. NPDC050630]|uniref:hypothetical protein n=1 Tax=Nocardia sp. NPDC050630 TaxID=3364321 RepID=UPI00379442BC
MPAPHQFGSRAAKVAFTSVLVAPAARRAMRVESEYRRGGTLAYFPADDVHRAHVIGRCEPSTGIEPFSRLTAQVMTTEPHASPGRVFWIVDNAASHRNWAAARLNDAYPNAHMVHLPVHASWLNQGEVYFSEGHGVVALTVADTRYGVPSGIMARLR